MASAGFTIDNTTNAGAQEQFSGAVTVGAGEFLRVRFSEFSGPMSVDLEIVANGVTTFTPIDVKNGWATRGVAAGDVCRLRCNLQRSGRSKVIGVVETST